MINAKQLRELIIKPTLIDLIMYTDNAEELILFTYAVQNQLLTYLKSPSTSGLGIYHMLPETYNNIWQHFINTKPQTLLIMTYAFDCNRMPSEDRMIYDLRFATAMLGLFYFKLNEPFPEKNNPDAIWNYYTAYYNPGIPHTYKYKSIQNYLIYLNN